MSSAETITREIGGASLTIPTEALFRAWLEKQFFSESPAARLSAPKIGQAWQGGVYAGLMRGENGTADYHLIVAEGPSGGIEEITWGPIDTEQKGALSEYDGHANTLALCRASESHPAAEWAAGLSIGGHTDWYLPARRELALCYANVPELFEKAWHWSSTQYAGFSYYAWDQHFSGGGQDGYPKFAEFRARAVRRLVS